MAKFEAKSEAGCRLEYVFFNPDAGLEFVVTPEFAIDSQNGQISLRGPLDYEKKQNFFVRFRFGLISFLNISEYAGCNRSIQYPN